jgi:hypothetical protein
MRDDASHDAHEDHDEHEGTFDVFFFVGIVS